MKRKIKHWLQTRILPRFIWLFLRFLYSTLRVEKIGFHIPEEFYRQGIGVIHVLWHGRLLLAPFTYGGKEMYTLISMHRDGEMIANAVKHFGFRLVRGSSKKGGEEALKEMVRLAEENKDLSITPDGPKGPREVVKPGAAQVARLTGKPVIPFACSANPAKFMRSWDRFMVPLPFSRVVFIFGEPLFYREGEEFEHFRLRIEDALKAVTRQADELCAR